MTDTITPADTARELATEKQFREFDAWRERVRESLPDTAQRVFALRGRGYFGCGFHWYMEKELGRVIHDLNNHDRSWRSVADQITVQFLTQSLFNSLVKAEKSALTAGNQTPSPHSPDSQRGEK